MFPHPSRLLGTFVIRYKVHRKVHQVLLWGLPKANLQLLSEVPRTSSPLEQSYRQYFHTPEHFKFLRETFLHCQFSTTHCSQFNSKSILPLLCFSGFFYFFSSFFTIPSAALPLIANCIFLFVLFLVRNIVRLPHMDGGINERNAMLGLYPSDG